MFQKIIFPLFILTLICLHINVHLFAQVVEPIENPINIGERPTHLSFEFEQKQITKFQNKEFKVTTVMDTDLGFSADEIIVELLIKDIEVEPKNEGNVNLQAVGAFIGKKINFKIDTEQMDFVHVSIDGKPIPKISGSDKKALQSFTKPYSNSNLSLSGKNIEQDKKFEIDASEMLSPYGINSSFDVVFTAKGKTIFDNRKAIKFDYTGDGKVMDNIDFSYLGYGYLDIKTGMWSYTNSKFKVTIQKSGYPIQNVEMNEIGKIKFR